MTARTKDYLNENNEVVRVILEPVARAHTPGPWLVSSHPANGRLPVVSQVNGRSIGAVSWFGDMPEGFKGHEDECRANARLIAAAPDMLNALKAVADLKGWNADLPISATGIQVMQAIAKAEGGQP